MKSKFRACAWEAGRVVVISLYRQCDTRTDANRFDTYRGRADRTQRAEAAIDPSEDAVSIDAAIAMRATFAHDSPAVLALIGALMDLLTRDARIARRRPCRSRFRAPQVVN